MRNFLIYLVGVLIVVVALAYGAYLMGIEMQWILVGAAVAIGLGVMGGVGKAQKRE